MSLFAYLFLFSVVLLGVSLLFVYQVLNDNPSNVAALSLNGWIIASSGHTKDAKKA